MPETPDSENPYRSVTSVVSSTSRLAERLAAIRSTIDQEMGNGRIYGSSSDVGIVDELTEIIQEIRQLHCDFVEDHIEARFRKIEEKI